MGNWSITQSRGTTSQKGSLTPDGTSITVTNAGIISVPTTSGSGLGLCRADNVTITESAGVLTAVTATGSTKGITRGDGSSILNTAGVLSVPTATPFQLGLVQPDGTIITDTAGAITVAKGSSSNFGVVKVDNSSITASSGVISATGGIATLTTTGTSGAATFSGGTLNVPQYSGGGGGGTFGPTTQTAYTATSRVYGTVYQNTTGYPMWIMVSAYNSTSGAIFFAKTDSSNPPTTDVGDTKLANANATYSLSFAVMPGNYYLVNQTSGGTLVFNSWVEWTGSANATSTPYGACIMSTGQSVPSGTTTLLTFPTVVKDTGGLTGVTSNALVAPVAGWYTISGGIQWPNSSIGLAGLTIYVNGSIPINGVEPRQQFATGSGSGFASPNVSAVYYLNANDAVTLEAFQNNGSSLTHSGAFLSMAMNTTGASSSGGITQLSRQVVSGTSTSSITFSVISQAYTNLEVVLSAATSVSSGNDNLGMQVNGDTAAHYSAQTNYVGSVGGGGSWNGVAQAGIANVPGATASVSASTFRILIGNYAATTFSKNAVSHGCYVNSNGASGVEMVQFGWFWNSTAAITSITIFPTSSGTHFASGSTFTLYGWK